MNHKLPCELIRDLFPSYIDGLTSKVTNELVEEHVSECRSCREVLEDMKTPAVLQDDSRSKEEQEEIDFLKKTRKKTRKIIQGMAIVSVLVIAAVLIGKTYFIGSSLYSDNVICQAEVDGNHLSLNGAVADTGLGISSIKYKEEDGVVTVSFKAVNQSPFHKREFQSEYDASQEITQVQLDNRIVWSQGKKISALTSAVYNSKHPYVGDMPANGRTVIALNLVGELGNFKNQLQTSEEPYGWTMTLENEIAASQQSEKENLMKSYAYILLAVTGNLGEVSFEYTVDGEMHTLTIDTEDASAFSGQDIKTCSEDAAALQELLEKAGLDG
ncbi:MAG: DUF4825 domain-containing protein [Lachnospiraceae bacterium]|nr:DUF4825 domain-containing protein [Lachnospiraceae bacterium]